MKVTLPEFERAGVMVVGDVMLDRYWYENKKLLRAGKHHQSYLAGSAGARG